MVIKIAALFNVPVSELLGMETQTAATGESRPDSSGAPHPAVSDVSIKELTQKLAQLNEQLAEKNKAERRMKLVSQKRGVILFLCFAAVIFSASLPNPALAACAVGVCFIAALLILYKNLALFTSVTAEKSNTRVLTISTFFNIAMILVVITTTALTEAGIVVLPAGGEKIFATAVITIIIIFSGMISPRLPFNRHIGLRLPWTVRDEDTWNVAHRILGITALPVALFYIAAVIVANDSVETVTLCAVAFWIGIPALVSYIYYYRKTHACA